MEYGKLVNGKLVYAEKSELRYADKGELLGNHYVYSFTEQDWKELGYKEIIFAQIPDYDIEIQGIELTYSETNTQIIEHFRVINRL